MRVLASIIVLAVAGLSTPAAFGQAPVQNPEPDLVFEAAAPKAPAPDKVASLAVGSRIDPASMAATVTNSVVNAGGWSGAAGAWTTGRPDVDQMILGAASRHGVDPRLVYSVMHQESHFKAGAMSSAGACGYMQLMPGTARRFGVTNIFDPQQNINAGTKYLRFLLDLFNNNVELALAGYNAGEYRVIREGYRVPRISETQNYVRIITSRYYGGGGGARTPRYTVTFGPATVDKKEREAIALKARATTKDRDDEPFETTNANGETGFSNFQ